MLSSILASSGLTHQLNGEHPCWPVVWSEKPDTPLAEPWPGRVQHPSPGQLPWVSPPPPWLLRPLTQLSPPSSLASHFIRNGSHQADLFQSQWPLVHPALPEVSSHLVGSSLPWSSEASPGHIFKQHPTASIPIPSPCFPAVTLPARHVVTWSVHPATKMEAPCRPRLRWPCSLGLEVASTSDIRHLLSDKRLSPPLPRAEVTRLRLRGFSDGYGPELPTPTPGSINCSSLLTAPISSCISPQLPPLLSPRLLGEAL